MANDQGQVLYSWEAAEFVSSTRGGNWHWWTYGAAVLVAIIMIWIHQWVLLAVVVMASVVLWLLGRMQPREFHHVISDKGVGVGDKLWPYSELRSFWMVQAPTGNSLRVSSAKKYATGLTLQLGSADVEKIRTTLSSYLPEEPDREEDLVDRVGRFLRF